LRGLRGEHMLKRIGREEEAQGAAVRIADASFPEPFRSGLEYGAPARGTWNIVHTGMLIPEAHEIFVCASNCLRGVVLTAAEMGLEHRFSTVTIKENNVLDGDMEELIVEGVTDILQKLPTRPRAVLVYTSCIHHFMGCDLELCYAQLRSRFPDIAFTDCYMNPIMRKSGLTPDQLMRRQLYSLLEKRPLEEKYVNIIGNNFSTHETSDLISVIHDAGWSLREITRCETYEEYLEMAQSAVNITYNPAAKAAGDALEKRLGQTHLYLPFSFTPEKIQRNLQRLSQVMGTSYDSSALQQEAVGALEEAKKIIGETPIAIDYTVVPAPLSLAKLLIEHGFCVKQIYIDAISGEEKDEFEWLKKNAPDLMLYATVHVKMRVLSRTSDEKILAIGQKAAYFTGTNYFVNLVEGAGLYGFDGIKQMTKLMIEAYTKEQDASVLIQQKGWGCSCCL
jgi:hypothetical protein